MRTEKASKAMFESSNGCRLAARAAQARQIEYAQDYDVGKRMERDQSREELRRAVSLLTTLRCEAAVLGSQQSPDQFHSHGPFVSACFPRP